MTMAKQLVIKIPPRMPYPLAKHRIPIGRSEMREGWGRQNEGGVVGENPPGCRRGQRREPDFRRLDGARGLAAVDFRISRQPGVAVHPAAFEGDPEGPEVTLFEDVNIQR